eukprot:gene27180-35907_t
MAPDICVLSVGSRLVGVIEIKKHQKNVLQIPTVLGELFDQMILIEGFYMSGPVIGILTTLEDLLFCWFLPADTAHFSSELEPYSATSTFLTPQKASAPTAEQITGRTVLSHLRMIVKTLTKIKRALHTSPIINAYTQYDLLLQYLCSSFTHMTQATLNQRRGVPRIRSNKFPRANTKMRWKTWTGKVVLLYFIFFPRPLRAEVRKQESLWLMEGKKWWDAVYPQFQRMTKVLFMNEVIAIWTMRGEISASMYVSKNNHMLPVLFELERISMEVESEDWVTEALSPLLN